MRECVLHLEEDDERILAQHLRNIFPTVADHRGEARDGNRYLTAQTIDGFRFWHLSVMAGLTDDVRCRG
jgi:hypothetical protein